MLDRLRGRWEFLAACLLLLLAVGTWVRVRVGPPPSAGPEHRDESRGRKLTLNGSELYYADPVSEAETRRVADALGRYGLLDGGYRVAEMRRVGDAYQFRVPVAPAGAENDPGLVQGARQVARLLSRDALGGAPVEVHLCDTRMQTARVVTTEDPGNRR